MVIYTIDQRSTALGRVAWGAAVGTAIESYDFFIYGMAAALVFPTVFFPHLNSTLATLASMGAFASAFLSRPLGAVVFGHLGDRLGRTRTLAMTLLIMGAATVAVGLVPTTGQIGVVAPLLLLALRLVQGLAAGGEWSGSAVLTAEYAAEGKRGTLGMFTPLGAGFGIVASNAVFLAVNLSIGEKSSAFLSWGWRIPFLFSAVLVGVALYLRLRVAETPVFEESAHDAKAPVLDLVRHHWRQVLLGIGATVSLFAFFFLMLTYLMGYAVSHLHHPRWLTLLTCTIGGLVEMAATATAAIASDRFGRRRVMLFGIGVTLPWSLLLIPLIDTGSRAIFVLAIVATFGLAAIATGPLPSLLAEIFPTRLRYSGIGLSYNIGGIIGGALPPVLAGPLVAAYGSGSIGVMIAVLTTASLLSVYLIRETKDVSLSQ